MGIIDAFTAEDKFTIGFSQLYALTKEAAKADLLMNAVNTNVPHSYIREMMTGVKEEHDHTPNPLEMFGVSMIDALVHKSFGNDSEGEQDGECDKCQCEKGEKEDAENADAESQPDGDSDNG